MPIKSGDFVIIDYILKVKETGEVFDVTMEDQAKSANVYSPQEVYEPKLLVVGQSWMLKGIDELVTGAEEGQEKEAEIPPEKAFGLRDGKRVEIVPARQLTSQGIRPIPGQRIEVQGQLATIRAVSGGRVTIDYNHPLAGRTLNAKVYVRKNVTAPEDRIRELIHRRVREVPKDKFLVSNLGAMVSIQMPEESFTLENIQYAKKGLAKEISRYFPEVTTVQFTESHIVKAPAPKPAEEKAAAAPPAEATAEQAPAEAKPEAAAAKTEKKSAKAKKSQQSEQ
ncbi:MAG TPA: FKBP-type peptidyl-prolyl cis-trans isomerase [Candidatus Methanomethylicus sp.]|nr:FKBP-type peptidyl-prolyl cis-trans isomerase [Candidatus Methanomethylicus sp.]HRR54339.1 FKBP-type peptidyl-prolyl cis-trans isomerase [Candidatus Methanomethylicus sp.]